MPLVLALALALALAWITDLDDLFASQIEAVDLNAVMAGRKLVEGCTSWTQVMPVTVVRLWRFARYQRTG